MLKFYANRSSSDFGRLSSITRGHSDDVELFSGVLSRLDRFPCPDFLVADNSLRGLSRMSSAREVSGVGSIDLSFSCRRRLSQYSSIREMTRADTRSTLAREISFLRIYSLPSLSIISILKERNTGK